MYGHNVKSLDIDKWMKPQKKKKKSATIGSVLIELATVDDDYGA